MSKQVREQVYFTDGRIYVKGNQTRRGKGKKADYILYYKPNIAIAVIEAKKNIYPIGHGMQQALNRLLDEERGLMNSLVSNFLQLWIFAM